MNTYGKRNSILLTTCIQCTQLYIHWLVTRLLTICASIFFERMKFPNQTLHQWQVFNGVDVQTNRRTHTRSLAREQKKNNNHSSHNNNKNNNQPLLSGVITFPLTLFLFTCLSLALSILFLFSARFCLLASIMWAGYMATMKMKKQQQ